MAHGVVRSTLSGTVRHLLAIVGEALQEGSDMTPQLPIPLPPTPLVTGDVPVVALARRPR